MWVKITIKMSYFKYVGFVLAWHLLVLGGGPMSCSCVGDKFSSQCFPHKMLKLGGGFFFP